MIPLGRDDDSEGSTRREDRRSGALFSYIDVEARIAAKHPLRAIRRLTNAALAESRRSIFEALRGVRAAFHSAGAVAAGHAI
jgi:hypothetical protein